MTRRSAALDHTPAYPTVDLTTCDREPIHVPGAIQPHGFLLSLDDDLQVVMASANCSELLGGPPPGPVGRAMDDVLGRGVRTTVERAVAGDVLGTPIRTTLPPGDGRLAGQEVDLVVHRSGIRVVLEGEPVVGSGSSPAVSYRSARAAVTRLTQTTSTADLCGRLATEIRAITGFDRVMVYRFDEHWNGEVVAEDRRDDLNPFLGLHYPASDIPAQARRLYTVNWTRLIADIGYVPVPLEPVVDPGTGAPLDLSHSVLRSVSPIHVEYLTNMGVSASMSVSMVKDGVLWGLVACHHYSGPHRVSHDGRSAAEFLGQTASQLIDDRERADRRADELHASVVLARITAGLAADPRPVFDALLDDPRVLELVGATGVALSADGRLLTAGDVPDAAVLREIAARVASPDGRATASSHLAGLAPELADVAHVAAGALHLGNGPDRWLLWLRPEQERTVDWGGDPTNKAIAAAEGPDVRLSPRKSFALWRQVVRGHSTPWVSWHLDVAENLRQHLSGELLRRSREHIVIAESLQREIVLDEAPRFDGLDVVARYRPAEGSQLGGDWWDAFTLPDGRVLVAVGDVAGHGVTAATAMAQVRTALRAYALDGHGPAACLDKLDRFVQDLLPGHTATLVVAAVDAASRTVEMANAGHPAPLLVRGGAAERLAGAGRPLLGVGTGSASTELVRLAVGDLLVLFTDGLVESRGVVIDQSIDRLADRLASADPGQTLSSWVDAALTAVSGRLDDDLTVVTTRLSPAHPTRSGSER